MDQQFLSEEDFASMGTWLSQDYPSFDGSNSDDNDLHLWMSTESTVSFETNLNLPHGIVGQIPLGDDWWNFEFNDMTLPDVGQSIDMMNQGNAYPWASPSQTSSMEVGVSPVALNWSPPPPQNTYPIPVNTHTFQPMLEEEQLSIPNAMITESMPNEIQLPVQCQEQQITQMQRESNGGESGKRRFVCIDKSCGKKTKTNRDLERHYNTRHPEIAKKLGVWEESSTCGYCGKSYSRGDRLLRHLSNKHGRPYKARSPRR